MRILVGGRAYGKTFQLVKDALFYKGILLVATHTEKYELQHLYPTLVVFTCQEYFYGGKGKQYDRATLLFIDNADAVLKILFPGLKGMSFSVIPEKLDIAEQLFVHEYYGTFFDAHRERGK